MASFLRTAHGNAAKHGALLVAECPPLDEIPRSNAAQTEQGLAIRKARGRPFQKGNTAAAGRGPSLTRITCDPEAPEAKQQVYRKAASLKNQSERELCVQYGLEKLSVLAKRELVAYARAASWADFFDRAGDPTKAASFDDKASGHALKAVALAERQAQSQAAKKGPANPLEAWGDPPKQ